MVATFLILLVGLLSPWLMVGLFPSLPARFDPPGNPFFAVVRLADTLAMVAQAAPDAPWAVQDGNWTEVLVEDCACPARAIGQDLAAMQRHSNLESISLSSADEVHYLLSASRDDLGGPRVAYRYQCGPAGILPELRYDSFFGFSYPVLGWRYSLSVGLMGGMLGLVAIGWMGSLSRRIPKGDKN
jgi:hypothetical protein